MRDRKKVCISILFKTVYLGWKLSLKINRLEEWKGGGWNKNGLGGKKSEKQLAAGGRGGGGMEASLVYYALRVHKILITKGKRKPDQVLNICSSTFFVSPFLATTIWTNFILSHVFDCTVFIKLS